MNHENRRSNWTATITLFLCAFASPAWAALPVAVDSQPLPTLAPMLERVTPAVVNIATVTRVRTKTNPLLDDPFFRNFFDIPRQPRYRKAESVGSGVIVDSGAGYILTNHHVVEKADVIKVTLSDGRSFDAQLVGADPDSDVAVIRIQAQGLTALPIAPKRSLQVGDFVVAIGNPFGLGQTVTSGIVSALGRTGLGIEGYEDFIQTDASINPGNSGGALVNLRGELVGINTAIIAPGGGNVGIGFAIPIGMARDIKEQLVEHGEVRRGQLGITAQDLTPELARAFNIGAHQGAVIAHVTEGSAAHEAGLQVGDVIVEIDDQPVRGTFDVRNRVGLVRVGQPVTLKILRDGEAATIRAVVARPRLTRMDGEQVHPRFKGAVFGAVSEPVPELSNHTGVVLLEVERGSDAWHSGLRAGDWLLSLNRIELTDLDDLSRAANADSQRRLLVNLQRGDSALFMLIR